MRPKKTFYPDFRLATSVGVGVKRVLAWGIDLLLVALASLLASIFRQNFELSAKEFVAFLPLLTATLIAAAVIIPLLGLNRAIWRFSGRSDYLNILAASVLIILAAVTVTFAFNRLEGIPRALPVRQAMLIFLFLGGARFFMQLRHVDRRGRPSQFAGLSQPIDPGWTLIVGLNPLTELYLRAAEDMGDPTSRIAGLLADRPQHTGRRVRRHPILGTPEQVCEIVQDLELRGIRIERIVLSSRWTQVSAAARAALRRLEASSPVQLIIMANVLGLETAEATVEGAGAPDDTPSSWPPLQPNLPFEGNEPVGSGGHYQLGDPLQSPGEGPDGSGPEERVAPTGEPMMAAECRGLDPVALTMGRLGPDEPRVDAPIGYEPRESGSGDGGPGCGGSGATRSGAPAVSAVRNAALELSAEEREQIAARAYWRWKRGLDVVAALGLGVVFSPLIVLAAMLVLIDLGRPILFWQHRPGLGGRSFRLYKLRTMSGAHDANGRRRDERDRSSSIGQFLRATRLDELPQLYHILVGQMSFIGPRPLLPIDQPVGFEARLLVRPGLTGWAQVQGGRALNARDKAELDVWYIRHASLRLDLDILMRTVRVVLRGEGAQPSVAAGPAASGARDPIAPGPRDPAPTPVLELLPQHPAGARAGVGRPGLVAERTEPPPRRTGLW